MRVLLSAGPMRTYLDPVRYLQNSSSGLLGLELARALGDFKNFKKTVVLLGPVDSHIRSEFKKVTEVHDYQTSSEYRAGLLKLFPTCDLFISCAAVLDFEIEKQPKKISRADLESSSELKFSKRNVPDFVAWLSNEVKNAEQKIFAFSLDTSDETAALERARKKQRAKNCEWIFVNYASDNEGPEKSLSSGVLLGPGGEIVRRIAKSDKRDVAKELAAFLGSQPWLKATKDKVKCGV